MQVRVAAGEVLPPGLAGHDKFDLYEAATRPHGDLARARRELAACGQPGGFSTAMAFAADLPKEKSAAAALQQALSRAGITVTLQEYPSGTFFSSFAGVPDYVHQHDLGLVFGAWGADWPDGYGFLYNLVAGPAIAPAGNPNVSELDDPAVNRLFITALVTASTTARNRICCDRCSWLCR